MAEAKHAVVIVSDSDLDFLTVDMHDEIGDQELTYSSWEYKPVIIAETRF